MADAIKNSIMLQMQRQTSPIIHPAISLRRSAKHSLCRIILTAFAVNANIFS
jgi:hypothetical protein